MAMNSDANQWDTVVLSKGPSHSGPVKAGKNSRGAVDAVAKCKLQPSDVILR